MGAEGDSILSGIPDQHSMAAGYVYENTYFNTSFIGAISYSFLLASLRA
jgi:hypothetical protein